MATKKKVQVSDFPIGLSQPALRALEFGGYMNLADVAKATEAEVKNLHGMGQKGIDMLRTALAEKGLSFAAKSSKK